MTESKESEEAEMCKLYVESQKTQILRRWCGDGEEMINVETMI